MKNKMISWLTQESTKLGFGSAIMVVLSILVSKGMLDAEWVAGISAILAVFGLGTTDKGLKKKNGPSGGATSATLAVVIGVSAGCGASISGAQIQAASIVACSFIEESGCYEELADALPGLEADNCSGVVADLLAAADAVGDGDFQVGDYIFDADDIDVSKILALKNGKCSKIAKALGAD